MFPSRLLTGLKMDILRSNVALSGSVHKLLSHDRYDGMGPATFWSGAPSLADLTCA